jgi:hypothetical protein
MTPSNTLHPQVETIGVGLPPLLTGTLTALPPGTMLPPGPRMNPWHHAHAQPAPLTGRLRRLLLGLWRPGAFHLRADGTPTSIPQRPVPSAGGTYPVHTHLVVGRNGFDDLGPGLYVHDHERSQLLQRPCEREQIDHWPEAVPASGDVTLILTVQPGRSFGRYRQRAWPLWIADTAYAQQAVEFLLAMPLRAMLGPSSRLRRMLGVPAATATELWLARGLVPEIPLVALNLPSAWEVDRRRQQALAARRSPDIESFTPKPHRSPKALQIAALSGQSWVQYADRVEAWSIPVRSASGQIFGALWQAHRAAATLCYSAVLSGRWQVRPVSGIPAADGDWTMHALAMLDTAPHPDREDDAP